MHKSNSGFVVNKNIKPVKAPCLRKIPEFFEDEIYWISYDGKTAQSCVLLDWFEGIVLIELNGKVECVNYYEIGANRTWAILNAVIEN